ncbi:MAG: hypothetical protein SGCHY_004208 [Lobulomycetales sp.]
MKLRETERIERQPSMSSTASSFRRVTFSDNGPNPRVHRYTDVTSARRKSHKPISSSGSTTKRRGKWFQWRDEPTSSRPQQAPRQTPERRRTAPAARSRQPIRETGHDIANPGAPASASTSEDDANPTRNPYLNYSIGRNGKSAYSHNSPSSHKRRVAEQSPLSGSVITRTSMSSCDEASPPPPAPVSVVPPLPAIPTQLVQKHVDTVSAPLPPPSLLAQHLSPEFSVAESAVSSSNGSWPGSDCSKFDITVFRSSKPIPRFLSLGSSQTTATDVEGSGRQMVLFSQESVVPRSVTEDPVELVVGAKAAEPVTTVKEDPGDSPSSDDESGISLTPTSPFSSMNGAEFVAPVLSDAVSYSGTADARYCPSTDVSASPAVDPDFPDLNEEWVSLAVLRKSNPLDGASSVVGITSTRCSSSEHSLDSDSLSVEQQSEDPAVVSVKPLRPAVPLPDIPKEKKASVRPLPRIPVVKRASPILQDEDGSIENEKSFTPSPSVCSLDLCGDIMKPDPSVRLIVTPPIVSVQEDLELDTAEQITELHATTVEKVSGVSIITSTAKAISVSHSDGADSVAVNSIVERRSASLTIHRHETIDARAAVPQKAKSDPTVYRKQMQHEYITPQNTVQDASPSREESSLKQLVVGKAKILFRRRKHLSVSSSTGQKIPTPPNTPPNHAQRALHGQQEPVQVDGPRKSASVPRLSSDNPYLQARDIQQQRPIVLNKYGSMQDIRVNPFISRRNRDPVPEIPTGKPGLVSRFRVAVKRRLSKGGSQRRNTVPGVVPSLDQIETSPRMTLEDFIITRRKESSDEEEELPPSRNLIKEVQETGGPKIVTTETSDFERLYADLCLLNLSLEEIQAKY